MLQAAWGAARNLVDRNGTVSAETTARKEAFLRRKCCRGLTTEDCSKSFDMAVAMAQTTIQFRRRHCGQLAPRTTRRYELLASLARELETGFTGCDDILIRSACAQLELEWDR